MENELIYLYQAEWCAYCANVRSKLTDLEIDFLMINVPRSKADRDALFQVSRQRGIPTLVHGDVLLRMMMRPSIPIWKASTRKHKK